MIGLSYYSGGVPHWNTECCYFGFRKHQWTWLYNVALLHLIGLGLRDTYRSSVLTSWGRGKYDSRIYVVCETVVY